MDNIQQNSDWLRLQAIIEYAGCRSVNEFSVRIGLTRAERLYRIKRGQSRVSRAMVDIVARHLPEISKGWLLTGEGAMLLDNSAQR